VWYSDYSSRVIFTDLLHPAASMILLGSVQRVELIRLLELHLGREKRQRMSANGEVAAEIVNEKKGETAGNSKY